MVGAFLKFKVMKDIEVTICETYHKTVTVQVPDNYTDADIKKAYDKEHVYIDDLLCSLRAFAFTAPSKEFYDNETLGWHCSESVIVEG